MNKLPNTWVYAANPGSLEDKSALSNQELKSLIMSQLNLLEDLLKEKLPSDTQKIIDGRLS